MSLHAESGRCLDFSRETKNAQTLIVAASCVEDQSSVVEERCTNSDNYFNLCDNHGVFLGKVIFHEGMTALQIARCNWGCKSFQVLCPPFFCV